MVVRYRLETVFHSWNITGRGSDGIPRGASAWRGWRGR
jgi:hypothetical protein